MFEDRRQQKLLIILNHGVLESHRLVDEMRPTHLSILIINWNSGAFLRGCVESILRHPPGCQYEIVIVDNASDDDSLAQVQGLPVTTLLNRDNLGFSRACNQAIRNTQAPFFLLLNPDTEVTEKSIDRLLSALDEDPSAAIAGARLEHSDGTLQVSVRHNPTIPAITLIDGFLLGYLIPQPYRGEWLLGRHWAHARKRPVPSVSGAAMLVRRAAADEAGLLDERFYMYAEDDEWCLRLRRLGWKVLFVPRAVVRHYRHQSSLIRWDRNTLARQMVSSRLRFHFQALPRPTYVAHLVATLAAYGPTLLWRKLRRVSGSTDTPYVAASWMLCWRELRGWFTKGRWPSAMAE